MLSISSLAPLPRGQEGSWWWWHRGMSLTMVIVWEKGGLVWVVDGSLEPLGLTWNCDHIKDHNSMGLNYSDKPILT